jgi:hypothetical protein
MKNHSDIRHAKGLHYSKLNKHENFTRALFPIFTCLFSPPELLHPLHQGGTAASELPWQQELRHDGWQPNALLLLQTPEVRRRWNGQERYRSGKNVHCVVLE